MQGSFERLAFDVSVQAMVKHSVHCHVLAAKPHVCTSPLMRLRLPSWPYWQPPTCQGRAQAIYPTLWPHTEAPPRPPIHGLPPPPTPSRAGDGWRNHRPYRCHWRRESHRGHKGPDSRCRRARGPPHGNMEPRWVLKKGLDIPCVDAGMSELGAQGFGPFLDDTLAVLRSINRGYRKQRRHFGCTPLRRVRCLPKVSRNWAADLAYEPPVDVGSDSGPCHTTQLRQDMGPT